MKILIVEDDPLLGECLKEFLDSLGHEKVVVCQSAQEAFDAIDGDKFDCVFVDVMLPDASGLSVLEHLKEVDPSVPVVMMSGHPTLDNAIEAMRKGASDFLAKPFSYQDLALTIERVARERKLLLDKLSLELDRMNVMRVQQLNEELHNKIDEQNKLFEVFKEIEAIRSSESLYPCIVNLATRLTAADKAGLFVISGDPGSLLLISDHGLNSPDAPPKRLFNIQCSWIKNLFDENLAYLVMRESELGWNGELKTIIPKGSAVACWPFRIRGQLFGFLMTCHNGNSSGPSESDCHLLDFLARKTALTIENLALYENLMANFCGILRSLVNALEAKDPYTGKHSERVTGYAVMLAAELRCGEHQIEALRTIGYLHDIGKIGIADGILNKPSSLSPEEYEQIKKHPVIGDAIVTDLGLSDEERSIIRHHHERWDGKGYPDGLARDDIPLLARIVAVADAYDSMTTRRAYRDPMLPEQALEQFRIHQGKQFDPDIVELVLARPDLFKQ